VTDRLGPPGPPDSEHERGRLAVPTSDSESRGARGGPGPAAPPPPSSRSPVARRFARPGRGEPAAVTGRRDVTRPVTMAGHWRSRGAGPRPRRGRRRPGLADHHDTLADPRSGRRARGQKSIRRARLDTSESAASLYRIGSLPPASLLPDTCLGTEACWFEFHPRCLLE
jgi:hypothetical protein